MAEYDNPLEAARRRMMPQRTGQSFFPAVNQRMFGERNDLLADAENTFYGGGNAQPTPTPTPTPRPRSFFGFNLNPSFQSKTPMVNSAYSSPSQNFGFGLNRQPSQNNPWEDWHRQYGFNF